MATDAHCHNGATFFVALEGVFEAQFEEGVLVRACIMPPDEDHVTNVDAPPWTKPR